MPRYDFRSLSNFDFEELVRDLLQQEYRVPLENFKSGRDQGIDLRYTKGKTINLVVQCKHFAESNFGQLKNHIKNIEMPKICKLKPSRYVLVTSLGLTPANKQTLLTILSPYCKSSSDIIGRERLNSLLGEFPEIERRNFKLWLTSKGVLDSVIHAKVLNRSDLEIEYIKKKLRYYVQNKSYFETLKILEQYHYCIIAGIPGIGKTTLAEILAVHYLSKGFEILKVTSDVGEAFEVLTKGKKQFVYYDDFLGQTTLETKFGKNEEQDLIRLCAAARKSPDLRIVMTTREYILNKAKLTYERLSSSGIDIGKSVIDLSSYSTFDKARILFNHLYFSDLPIAAKREVLTDRSYWKIINHKNYNPRIIEWMTESSKYSSTGEPFLRTFLQNLDNPKKIWEHAFENQVSDASRSVLFALWTLPADVHIQDLEEAFRALHTLRTQDVSGQTLSTLFQRALKELEGNFVKSVRAQSDIIVSFHNPSIKDFIESYLAVHSGEARLLIVSSVFFAQLEKLGTTDVSGIRSIIVAEHEQFWDKIQKLSTSRAIKLRETYYTGTGGYRYLAGGSRVTEHFEDRLRFAIDCLRLGRSSHAEEVVREMLSRILAEWEVGKVTKTKAVELIAILNKEELRTIIEQETLYGAIKHVFTSNLDTLDDFEFLLELERVNSAVLDDQDWRFLSETFENRHYQIATSEVEGIENSEDVREYLELLSKLGKEFYTDTSRAGIIIEDRLDTLEQDEQMRSGDPSVDDDFGSRAQDDDISNDTIDSMFDSMADR